MNTNSRTKKNWVATAVMTVIAFTPLYSASAQSDDNDDFGVWTTIEASKKINKKIKIDFEAELRTIEGVDDIERASFGAGVNYKATKWLKASAGYVFIYSHSPEEKKIKVDDVLGTENFGDFYDYNIDHDYWTERHRFHLTLTGEYKLGRLEFSLRERLQYTRTNSAYTDESKYRWEPQMDEISYEELHPVLNVEKAPELKESKHNTTLRSRLTVKWDISGCKITPFASAELYTRLDDWKRYDKVRYRLGASYKINKDNSISLYYLHQNVNEKNEPKTHAIGLGYSVDL
jgi:hypothetical protein